MHVTKTCYTHKEAVEFLERCDREFDQRIESAVSMILEKGNRFLCLAGPSCAGKTTTAEKITKKLADRGVKTHVISIDDFFYNMDYLLAMAEKKGGELDMDSVAALDLDAFAKCLSQIVTSGRAMIPYFDFHTHNRGGYRKFACEKDDIIIFEGIQAVYPELTSLINPYGMTSIFVCPDSAIEVGDQVFEPNVFRFYRRIVRDAQYRSADAQRTLEVWRGVRNNEDTNIFPYKDACDMVVDSTMAYDLHLLTPYLRELLPQVEEQSRYYLRALDILNRIKHIEPISAKLLKEDSLYREFIKF
jgi:uridine kinase